MTKEEYIERKTSLEIARDAAVREINRCVDEYIKERIPFEASNTNPVPAIMRYEYYGSINGFEDRGAVSGKVFVTGFEPAEIYGKNWIGEILPVIYRMNDDGTKGERVHFRLGARFDTITLTRIDDVDCGDRTEQTQPDVPETLFVAEPNTQEEARTETSFSEQNGHNENRPPYVDDLPF